jgi:hypothetical protein
MSRNHTLITLSKRVAAVAAVLAALTFAAMLSSVPDRARSAAPPSERSGDVPVLAYYYIWFNPTSWQRAKSDYPLLGRYSSDERSVMRQHIRWAKRSGIEGFIVSWKHTPQLDRRLEQLIAIATRERFKLAIIYQGLDFIREPLPVRQVAADVDYFEQNYADRRPFRFLSKPLVVWSGTWRFSTAEIASVTTTRRDNLLILASERHKKDYEEIAHLVDGDAYYWSSVNPDTFPGYQEKLAEMSKAVHDRKGLWIAPAAPGFDARLIGGTTVVERKGGETLRREYNAAVSSAPDMVGLISWNEFSENSHIEPSERFGSRYLRVMADIRGTRGPQIQEFESDEPGSTGVGQGVGVVAALVVLGFVGILIARGRRRGGMRPAERTE